MTANFSVLVTTGDFTNPMQHGNIFEDSGQPTLTWTNVGIGLAFILLDVGISTVFRLGIGLSLLIAALRCIGQLAGVATILQQVFENKNPWLVAFISCAYLPLSFDYAGTQDITVLLNFLGTFETGKSQPFSTMGSRSLLAISSYEQIPASLPLHGAG
jgi:Uncharacterised protein family (UPF0014)